MNEKNNSRIRLMLVDDHKILRDALRLVFEQETDTILVAETDNANEVIQLARTQKPDIVLMDIELPEISGIEITRRLLRTLPSIKVLALSTYSERHIVREMMEAGASGYVAKVAGRTELMSAIRRVFLGHIYLSPEIEGQTSFPIFSRNGQEKLSDGQLGRREEDVLRLLSDGLSSPQIGINLHIATSTVDVHRRNIMRKLNLHTIAELTKYAIRHGITST